VLKTPAPTCCSVFAHMYRNKGQVVGRGRGVATSVTGPITTVCRASSAAVVGVREEVELSIGAMAASPPPSLTLPVLSAATTAPTSKTATAPPTTPFRRTAGLRAHSNYGQCGN
jgi:hypothetical protein